MKNKLFKPKKHFLQKTRRTVLILAIVLAFVNLLMIDLDHILSRQNLAPGANIVVDILIFAVMTVSIRSKKGKRSG